MEHHRQNGLHYLAKTGTDPREFIGGIKLVIFWK